MVAHTHLSSNVITFLVAFILFVVNFSLTWVVTARLLRRHFLKFTLGNKADWCSRVNSTVHGLIVVPGFSISIASVKWRDSLEPVDYNDLRYVHMFMAISTAYFIVDLIIIILYRVPMWGVFVTHHLVAVVPLLISVFDVDCPAGAYILGLFLLVEFPTLSLNMQVFLEQTGRAQTRMYATFFYITYVLWIICRCVLPMYLLIVLWNNIYPDISKGSIACLGPGIAAAHLLSIFCFAVFVFILTKELRGRWATADTSTVTDVAVVRPGVGDDGGGELETVLPPDFSATPAVADHPTLPSVPDPYLEARRPNAQEIDWALGVERPASVMRHGGSVIR